jgi:Domain of unknown function (DUF1707)
MARYATLRASDADREAVAERLRRAAVEGRLEHDELEQRLDAALRARTYGELDRLLVDLPAPRAAPRPRAPVAVRSALALAIPVAMTLVAVIVVVTVVAVAAAGWMVWMLIWLMVWMGRGAHRHGRRRHGHVRRVHRTRPAGLL